MILWKSVLCQKKKEKKKLQLEPRNLKKEQRQAAMIHFIVPWDLGVWNRNFSQPTARQVRMRIDKEKKKGAKTPRDQTTFHIYRLQKCKGSHLQEGKLYRQLIWATNPLSRQCRINTSSLISHRPCITPHKTRSSNFTRISKTNISFIFVFHRAAESWT